MTAANRDAMDAALQHLAKLTLADSDYGRIFGAFCAALADCGLPLLRGHLAMRTLHPLLDSIDLTWIRGQTLAVNPREHRESPEEAWLQSPLHSMLQDRKLTMRANLRDPAIVARFPVFEEFRELGGTDYLAILVPFGDPETALERHDGIVTSWISDAPEGFSADDVTAIERFMPQLGITAKLAKHDHTARNVVSAYLGEDAGSRVLDGQIRLGDVISIPAVIWYSDLRDSTALAERMPVESFLEAVNGYFECTAGAVLDAGGEVLRFIGDAVLAVLPITSAQPAATAAKRAMSGAHDALQRMETLNLARTARSEEPLAFGMALHIGEVLYGNIGVATRLEFSVIGQAANEVARLEGLTKVVGESILVSQAFTQAMPLAWRAAGEFDMQGVGKTMKVFTPPK